MALFRRKAARPADPRPAIAAFWQWWEDHRGEVIAAVAAQRSDDLVTTLRPAVAALDGRLDWEIAVSREKTFTLIVSSGGNAELRAIAERWVLAAPDDPEVEFASTRRRDVSTLEAAVLKVDDYDIALGELVAGTRVDARAGKVDVVVHHPLYPLLDESHRAQVAFLGLDAAVGEDDSERWIASVTVSADAPVDAIPLSMLGGVIDQLKPSADQWAALQGNGPKGPILALVRRPFDRVDRPLADTHVAMVLGYAANANGMPADASVAVEIEQFEERALAALGGDGPHAAHLGHVTGGGQVVVHFYVDGLETDAGAASAVLDTWTHGKGSLTITHDPAWEAVAPLLG